MNPGKCIFFLVAVVFVVSCTGSYQKKRGRLKVPEQTTQLVRLTTPAPADPPPTNQPPNNPDPADRAQIENPLNVEPIAQEGEFSCWAACAEMIMRYVRNQDEAWKNVPAPRQCEQTEKEYPGDYPNFADCCDTNNNNCMKDGCSEPGFPEFTAWKFTCNTNINSPLPWEDATNPINSITGQINAHRPIAFSFRREATFSHMVVLIGYNSDADVRTITYLYSDFGNPTTKYDMIPLDQYNGEDPKYQHDYDYYNIQVSGDPPQ